MLGTVIACRLNAPGSWHDLKVAQPIYDKLRERTPAGFYIVADTAFPQGAGDVANHIQAPMKSGEVYRQTAEDMDEMLAFDRELLACHQAAEWGMQTIQGSFGRLQLPLDVNDAAGRSNLLEVCV